MKKIFMGCGIAIFLLCSCAANDHSRRIPLDINAESGSCIFMWVNFTLEKSGTETSKADQTSDLKLDATVTP